MSLLHSFRVRAIPVVALLVGLLSVGLASPAHAAARQVVATPHTWTITAGVTTPKHVIEGMAFLPGTITIDVGDTVVWKAGSADIHTIVLPGAGGQIQPYNPATYQPTSNTAYDGATYTASPVLTVLPQAAGVPFTATSYALTFTKAGTYIYACSVHQGMQGTIVVQPAGTPYPHSQAYYTEQAHAEGTRLIAQGWRLFGEAEEQATNHHVIVGIGNAQSDVMRFVRQTVVIRAGQSVTFTNMSMGPHTVTFGAEIGNPALPWGDPTHFDGSFPLNSGFLGVTVPASFTVTFTKPGVFQYKCALHDYMGMVGTVIVLPAGASN